VPWLHSQKNAGLRVLGSVVIQLYAGECTPSVDQVLRRKMHVKCTLAIRIYTEMRRIEFL